jgi:cullin-4
MTVVKKARSGPAEPVVDPSSPVKLLLSFQTKPPPISQSTLSSVWEDSLRPVVRAVLRGNLNSVAGKRELLYRQVERMVKIQFTKLLLEKLETEMNEYCESVFESAHTSIEDLESSFDAFVTSMELLSRIFNSLDREMLYMASSIRAPQICFAKDIMALGFAVWRSHLCHPDKDRSTEIVETLMELLHGYRMSGENLAVITKAVDMLLKIGIYSASFEPRFLQATRTFYSEAATNFLKNDLNDLSGFIDFVNRAFEFERSFAENTGIPASTWKSEDLDILRNELVLNRLPPLISKSLVALVRGLDTSKLRMLYSLSLLVPDKLILESVFRHSFQESVASVCSDAGDLIDSIIQVRRDMKRILGESFDNRPSFQGAYKDAMESVLNAPERATVCARLAEWVDARMFEIVDEEKGASPNLDWSDDLLGIFKLLNAKDIFEVHYRNLLAKRLLYISANFRFLGQNVNQESTVLNLFKQECGAGYTNKMESMIKDICASEEMAGDKALYCFDGQGAEFRVTVATTGVWPLVTPTDRLKLPQNIHDLEIHFMRKFMEKNEKKSIKFLPAMTSAIVRFKRREFVCSASQALVLHLFNASDVIEKTVALAETGLSEAEANKALETLMDIGMLVEEQSGYYSVNPQYKVPPGSGRVTINQYQYRKSPGEMAISEEERSHSESSAMEDRQHQLDATIVRVMKRVRKCNLGSLHSEILNVTKFAFSKQEITKRLASLVDREFIERDPGEDGEIRYLA